MGSTNLTAQGLFKILMGLKNTEGIVTAPNGGNVLDYLKRRTGKKVSLIRKLLDDLICLEYIKNRHKGKELFEIEMLKDKIEHCDFLAPKPIDERYFAIFLDYLNLEQNMPNPDRFRDFSWLTEPILKKGKILFAFVFIPEHYATRAPVMLLSNKHRFHVILCPRQVSGVTTKDADTVDSKINELAIPLIWSSIITDVILVSGDADFQPLAVFAKRQGKKVKVISAAEAVSGRFLEMEKDGQIDLELVN